MGKLLVIHSVHTLDQAQQLVGVTDLIVIPADHLHEGVGQRDAGLGVDTTKNVIQRYIKVIRVPNEQSLL